MPQLLEQKAPETDKHQSHSAPGESLQYADIMKSVPMMAKKLESGNISSDSTKADFALSFDNIYKSAGGGAAGKQAEDSLQTALNDQLKKDGSAIHVDKVNSHGGLLRSDNNLYAVVDESNGQYRSSGIISPETFAGPGTDKAPAAKDAKVPGDAPPAVTDAPAAKSPESKFSDKQTEQAYNRAAEDAALTIMSQKASPEQKAQAVIDAMNKAGAGSSVDIRNFENVLETKLGKNAHADAVTGGLSVHGVMKIDSGRGDHVELQFKRADGKFQLVTPSKDN